MLDYVETPKVNTLAEWDMLSTEQQNQLAEKIKSLYHNRTIKVAYVCEETNVNQTIIYSRLLPDFERFGIKPRRQPKKDKAVSPKEAPVNVEERKLEPHTNRGATFSNEAEPGKVYLPNMERLCAAVRIYPSLTELIDGMAGAIVGQRGYFRAEIDIDPSRTEVVGSTIRNATRPFKTHSEINEFRRDD